MTNQFDTKSILEAIANYAEEGNTLEDVQNYAFNMDPWIIGTYKAAKALEQFNEDDQMYEKTNLDGVFGAIQYVQDYEIKEFGDVNTELSDPEQLASMVAYINGEQVINNLADELDLNWVDELTEQQAKQLSNVDAMQALLNLRNYFF